MSGRFHRNTHGTSLETGGIIIGPKKHKNIITDIVPSSAYAERKASTYYQSQDDVDFLNSELKKFQAKGYDFSGYYHRHPSGMFYLSQGDLQTCESILTNPDYKINNHLIMCIITESQGNFPVFCYTVSIGKTGINSKLAKATIMPKQQFPERLK